LQASRELQDRTQDMDNDLANFVEELEKIDASQATVAEKANQLKVSHSMFLEVRGCLKSFMLTKCC